MIVTAKTFAALAVLLGIVFLIESPLQAGGKQGIFQSTQVVVTTSSMRGNDVTYANLGTAPSSFPEYERYPPGSYSWSALFQEQ